MNWEEIFKVRSNTNYNFRHIIPASHFCMQSIYREKFCTCNLCCTLYWHYWWIISFIGYIRNTDFRPLTLQIDWILVKNGKQNFISLKFFMSYFYHLCGMNFQSFLEKLFKLVCTHIDAFFYHHQNLLKLYQITRYLKKMFFDCLVHTTSLLHQTQTFFLIKTFF